MAFWPSLQVTLQPPQLLDEGIEQLEALVLKPTSPTLFQAFAAIVLASLTPQAAWLLIPLPAAAS